MEVAGRPRIDRVRGQYNQWVANQTLEDYALRFTAKSARRWSAARVANTALGAISFLALEAIGGTITLNYGVTNATAAILVVSVIIFFAIEALILASALEMCFGIPRPVGYLISAVVIILLVTYGITLISRFQLWTQPLWIILHILPFVAIAYANPHSFAEWRKFAGEHGEAGGQLDLLLFGTQLLWCFRWWRRSASRSTSCGFCRATAGLRGHRGGSRCSAPVPAGSSS